MSISTHGGSAQSRVSSMSRSSSHSGGHNYHMEGTKPTPQRLEISLTPPDAEVASIRQRWVDEMARGKSRRNSAGKPKGFGSWYRRKPFDYSPAEFQADQKHADRVRTADLTATDMADRDLADDDSFKESDWMDRTSIDPFLFRAKLEAEKTFTKHLIESKRIKRD